MKFLRLPVFILIILLTACVPPQAYRQNPAANNPAQPVAAAQATTANQSPAQLVVHGSGRVDALPDLLQLRLGVVTQNASADIALIENNQRMTAIMEQLTAIGIAADEMSTGQFQIRPEWSVPPRPTPANWQRQIVGYRVLNEVVVATTRVVLAGRLLSASQKSGANQVGNLQFSLADPADARQLAISQATENALRQAKTMAEAAGVTLGGIRSMSLDQPNGVPQPKLMMAEARMASADTVPVTAGKVEVSATVTMVFEIID